MRIKTSRTLKAIDDWKNRLSTRNTRFLSWMSILFVACGIYKLRSGIVFFLILGVSIHFAAMQFGSIVLLFYFTAKLRLYRMANFFLRIGIRSTRFMQ